MPFSVQAVDSTDNPHSAVPAAVISLLQALEIELIVFDLNGGGDDGEVHLEEIRCRDGSALEEIPALPIAITTYGAIATLDSFLSDAAADAPDGDWVNNEGGYGTITIFPFAPDPGDWLTCEMTFREYGDEDDEREEDWDETLDEFAVGDVSDDVDAEITIEAPAEMVA